ncbi:hypothetical protein bcere0013_8940 [Bacillus cereus BDRD-ST26]|nr:hypothetical protein bcere0013_8940 [Bacillus cereus BDRD-ST26]
MLEDAPYDSLLFHLLDFVYKRDIFDENINKKDTVKSVFFI